MSQDTSTSADPRPRTTARAGTRQRWPVLALLAMVVLLDQSTKWWGWRHAPPAIINSGGDMFVGPMVGGCYADPASGAPLDLVSVGLLTSALFSLLRRRSPTVALGSVALMIAGWTSTLLDRLVMHSWTATHFRHIPQRTTPN